MPDIPDSIPWMRAWQDTLRHLSGDRGDFMAIAGEWWKSPAPPGPEAMGAQLMEHYQRLFTPDFAQTPGEPAGSPGHAAAALRYQAAWQRLAQQIAAIAAAACERFAAELARTDPAAAPITSLRELHELWIDCGEAAYAAAAHGEAFAGAQAELLAAFVELRWQPPQAAR